MPRIIFTSRYLKNASMKMLSNYMDYIATRPNAEIYHPEHSWRTATIRQQEWIETETARLAEIKSISEYIEYQNNPSMQNASELIDRIVEMQLENGNDLENYVGYLAHRPRAEKLDQGHALWNGGSDSINLNQVKKEVSQHKGIIWTHVISLEREDAERLGYDNAKAWRELVVSKLPEIAKEMKISINHLKWYGAFHNESHHPHVHLMLYSENEKEGYLTKTGIENMRREFALSIFHDEIYQMYGEKDEIRKLLKEQFAKEIHHTLSNEPVENPKAEQLMIELSKNLKFAKQKKAYGRLTKENRELVDDIVKELSQTKEIKELYDNWIRLKESIAATYTDQPLPKKALDKESEFRNIKNMVLKYATQSNKAAQMDGDTPLTAQPVDLSLPEPKVVKSSYFLSKAEQESNAELEDGLDEELEDEILPPENAKFEVIKKYWTKDFKKGREILKEDKESRDDQKAYQLFLQEAKNGNPFAKYSLAGLLKAGKVIEKNEGLANQYFHEAFDKILAIEQEAPNDFTEYYLGKMSNAGEGVEADLRQAEKWFLLSAKKGNTIAPYALGKIYFSEGELQDKEKAVTWYKKAVLFENCYAMYALGKMYFNGDTVKQSFEEALKLYEKGANGGMPYAAYQTAEMYAKGEGAEVNLQLSEKYYQIALKGFLLELEAGEDNTGTLGYKIGKMYLEGKGCEIDTTKGIKFLKEVANKNNVYALFALLKMSIKNELSTAEEEMQNWIARLEVMAEQKENFALYSLGYYYMFSNHRDVEKAEDFLKVAVEQNNVSAVFLLQMLDSWKKEQVQNQFQQLVKNLSRMIQEDYQNRVNKFMRTESKLLQKIREKKLAQGQKVE